MAFGGKTIWALRVLVALQAACLATGAAAHSGWHHRHYRRAAMTSRVGGRVIAPVIQCVAFAKWDAGIDIAGNARDWWENAAGVYQRGTRPESGSVLSFRPNERMPLGHVAVVAGIADSRTIIIDQSHWNSRGITRDIQVKDVSENNDWSAVRVQLGRGAAFGSIYPTHGFIYPRPDDGGLRMTSRRLPVPIMDALGESLRRQSSRRAQRSLEVAEAPESGKALDLTVPDISFDAPNRALR